MSNQEFLKASARGDLEIVRKLFSSKKIDINTQDVLNQNHS